MQYVKRKGESVNAYDNLIKCLGAVRERTDFVPRVAIVLGSGLGGFASEVDVRCLVEFKDIEGFPTATAVGHQGRFIFGYVEDVPVAVMQGRIHFYEGYGMEDVVLPVRLMGLLGARALFLTNAAGGINPDFGAGDLMMIRDQISLFVPSPLNGENLEKLGPRFPDMSRIYDPELCDAILGTAAENDIALKEGVYVQLTGPQYESPAEIRLCRALGADAVGMSTACEAIAATHMGIRVCGASLISNAAAGMAEAPLNHGEVMEAGRLAAGRFARLTVLAVAAIDAVL